ncbi:unnamed protein product, partial [Laminaria digitata]
LKYPVHCAASGGNVELLTWLMEDRCCPVFKDRAKTVRGGVKGATLFIYLFLQNKNTKPVSCEIED